MFEQSERVERAAETRGTQETKGQDLPRNRHSMIVSKWPGIVCLRVHRVSAVCWVFVQLHGYYMTPDNRPVINANLLVCGAGQTPFANIHALISASAADFVGESHLLANHGRSSLRIGAVAGLRQAHPDREPSRLAAAAYAPGLPDLPGTLCICPRCEPGRLALRPRA